MVAKKKKCPKCKRIRDLKYFGKIKKADGSIRYQSYCKECQSAYAQTIYKEDPAKWHDAARARRDAVGKKVYEYLLSHPCTECPEARPECLQFDHIDPSTKTQSISNLVSWISWKSLLKEIAKCRVLCANCHRKRTARDREWYKSVRDYLDIGSVAKLDKALCYERRN